MRGRRRRRKAHDQTGIVPEGIVVLDGVVGLSFGVDGNVLTSSNRRYRQLHPGVNEGSRRIGGASLVIGHGVRPDSVF